jgi:hypothetical protein
MAGEESWDEELQACGVIRERQQGSVPVCSPAVPAEGPILPDIPRDWFGEDGIGAGYKARDTHLDRIVAIQVLPPRFQPLRADLRRTSRRTASAGVPST